jgi:histidine triad (HIT) family protein
VVHETDDTLAFRDIDPKAPVHVLVIPKAHHRDVAALAFADPGLTGDGYRIIFNVGANGGQEVFHVHGHVLGGQPLGRMLSV